MEGMPVQTGSTTDVETFLIGSPCALVDLSVNTGHTQIRVSASQIRMLLSSLVVVRRVRSGLKQTTPYQCEQSGCGCSCPVAGSQIRTNLVVAGGGEPDAVRTERNRTNGCQQNRLTQTSEEVH
jgi:hypothetical protein